MPTTITTETRTEQTVTIDHVTRIARKDLSLVDIMGEATYRELESRGIGARGRCQNPKDKDYRRYGGRGIEFRFATILDFIGYMYFSVGYRSGCGLSIDRINNDGHYEAGNLRLATKLEQTHNRSIPVTTFEGAEVTYLELYKEMKRRGSHMLVGGVRALVDLGYPGENIIKIANMDI